MAVQNPDVSTEALAPDPLPFEAPAHFSPAEHMARGKAARVETPRRGHAGWTIWADRPDPIDVLAEQATHRMPELLPIRYGRMSASPFAFFRGGAAVMAADLASTPRSGLRTQVCGDAHLANFGVFAAPDRSLIFDINDFDETLPGPWEWDIKRLAASFEVAMRDRGIDPARRRDVLLAGLAEYRSAIAAFAEMRAMEVWYSRQDAGAFVGMVRELTDKKAARSVKKGIAKASGKDSLRALEKLTVAVDGVPRFVSRPPLLVPATELLSGEELDRFQDTVRHFLQNYRASLPDDRRHLVDEYEFRQIARKVVGVGSVGMRAWVVLMLGRDASDPLFLQLKQAEASVLERFVGRSRYRNHGRRVVEGQRLMQAASDVLLGWYRVTTFDGLLKDFYVRQLWDGKASVDVAEMPESLFAPYARACNWTLARAHARAGDRIAIAGYLGRSAAFDEAIADFATSYAEQNERDYELLLAAIKSGRLEARTGI